MLIEYIKKEIDRKNIKGILYDRYSHIQNLDPEGKSFVIKFQNELGLSMLQHKYAFCTHDTWELAVVTHTNMYELNKIKLFLEHPICNGDVLRNQTVDEVMEIITKLSTEIR